MFRLTSRRLLLVIALATACGKGGAASDHAPASGTGAASSTKTPRDKLAEQILQLHAALDKANKDVEDAKARGATPDELANLQRAADAITGQLRKDESIFAAMEEQAAHGGSGR